MDHLSEFEMIRRRPGMYIGDTQSSGLHHLFGELLDNVVDQFLANKATTIRASIDGELLEVVDDGPGLPFDVEHESSGSLGSHYLSIVRRGSPTADGHTPHVHLGGWGVGLRVVTALTHSCEVQSTRHGKLWRQSFTRGVADGPAEVIQDDCPPGTTVRATIDREIFPTVNWSSRSIEERLAQAAYLFPGFRVETPTMELVAKHGLADWAKKLSGAKIAHDEQSIWINGRFGDLQIQVGTAGTECDNTQWHGFANGNRSVEGGSHLTALKRALSACGRNPAVAMIHVIMQSPKFAGPTRSKLDAPDIIAPIYQAITTELHA